MPLVLSGDGAVGPLSATEVSYLDGVTSAVQTQLNGKAATPGAWSDYTATLTNITIGNGTVVSRYMTLGKLVIGYVKIVFGSTSSMSTNPAVSGPVTAKYAATEDLLGTCRYYDNSAGQEYVGAVRGDGYLVTSNAGANSGRPSSTAPFTWATSDSIAITFLYEAA